MIATARRFSLLTVRPAGFSITAMRWLIFCTLEAIYNSLFRARTMSGSGVTVPALPLEETTAILRRHGVIGY